MDTLTDLIRKFEEAEEASQEARRESERARDYYDGRQLTADEISALKKRKQPIVIENLIQPKVDYLCGLERQTRTDPKAYPRTAAHEDDATAATDALRYVADDQNIDVKRSMVFQNMLVEGFGGVEVIAHQTKDGIDPKIVPLTWDRIFTDPHSCQADFSDAMYLGFVTWMDASEAKGRWQGKEAIIDRTVTKSTSSITETFDDKPKWTHWADKTRNRVRVVTIYCKKSEAWYRSVFTLAGELEEMAPSPWLDDEGQPECGLILQSAYVDRDNDRYGPVRNWMSLQDEVNKRRSKFLHLANSRQVRVGLNSEKDAESIRRELSRPDGVIVADQNDIEVIGTGDMSAGHFNLLAEAKQAIQLTGPNATMQGKSGQDQSGRAILALQQGGMTEMAPLLDNLRHFNIRLFRAIWNRIRQFWTAERWVRVTDDEKNVRFVGLNVTQGHMAIMKVKDALKAGEIDEATASQYAQQIQMDPQMQQPANAVATMDVDIQIDETMDSPTLQIEQFEQLAKLAPMAPPEYLPTMFELMIEASNLRNKDKLREITKKLSQPQEDPMAAPMQELQMAGAQAEVEKTQSETAKNMATAQATLADVEMNALQTGMQMAA
jgi:Glucosamine-6-phosphate isomerases/6-phosphogluconolactonase